MQTKKCGTKASHNIRSIVESKTERWTPQKMILYKIPA